MAPGTASAGIWLAALGLTRDPFLTGFASTVLANSNAGLSIVNSTSGIIRFFRMEINSFLLYSTTASFGIHPPLHSPPEVLLDGKRCHGIANLANCPITPWLRLVTNPSPSCRSNGNRCRDYCSRSGAVGVAASFFCFFSLCGFAIRFVCHVTDLNSDPFTCCPTSQQWHLQPQSHLVEMYATAKGKLGPIVCVPALQNPARRGWKRPVSEALSYRSPHPLSHVQARQSAARNRNRPHDQRLTTRWTRHPQRLPFRSACLGGCFSLVAFATPVRQASKVRVEPSESRLMATPSSQPAPLLYCPAVTRIDFFF